MKDGWSDQALLNGPLGANYSQPGSVRECVHVVESTCVRREGSGRGGGGGGGAGLDTKH
jgi:hypothetical protein